MPSRISQPTTRFRCHARRFPLFSQFSIASLILSIGTASAAPLLNWDVTGSTGATGSAVASAPVAGVSGSILTGGGTTGNSTSPAGTWNRTYTVQANYTDAQTAGNYISFTTTADSGYTVSISGVANLTLRRTSTGPNTVGLFYSTDNVTFTQTGTSTVLADTNFTSADSNFSSTMSATPIVINGGQTLYWRIVVYGGTGNRFGIGNANPIDFTLTGTSVPDVTAHNLLWTGTGGNDWNTTPSNTNWADTDLANAAAAFVTNDNVTINIPATIAVDAGGVGAGNVTVSNGSGTVGLAGGNISGLTLSKSGAGTLSIAGTNTFSGGVSLTGGTLQAEGDGAIGTGGVSIDGATLKTGSGVSLLANTMSIGTGGATIDTDANVQLSGQFISVGAGINASNQITKSGAGVLTISKTSSTAFGAQTTSGNPGGMLELDITAGGVIFTGTGQRNLGGTNTWNAPVTLNGGTLMLHGGAVEGTGTISVTAASKIYSRLNFGNAFVSNPISVDDLVVLTLDSAFGSNALQIDGVISGLGAVTKTGNGLVRIAGNSDYSGITTIDSGTLRVGVGASGSLGSGNIVFATPTSSTTPTLQFSRSDDVVVANSISGAGNISKFGAGTTSLTGTNSHSGNTTISDGILRIDGDSSAATDTITVQTGGALGGNGATGASVVMESGAALAATISDWTGTAGTGYDDLAVLSLDAGSFPIAVAINTTGLVNFTEEAKSFTILNTSTGITGLVPGTVTFTAPGFPGTGTWALAESSGSLVLSYTPGITYATWISGYIVGGLIAATDDFDNDGLDNAVENLLGSNPSVSNTGLYQISSTPGTLKFRHEQSNTIAVDVTGSYQWTTDLAEWKASGETNAGGTSATIVPATITDNDAPANDLIEVTVSVTGGPATRIFCRLVATKTP
ncbi:MAG: beta strand repeat-containing protein [Luteolibacter sp.]